MKKNILDKLSPKWPYVLVSCLAVYLIMLNWSELTQIVIAFSTASLAFSAYKGLDSWKEEKKVGRKMNILDEVSDTSHNVIIRIREYIPLFTTPIHYYAVNAIPINPDSLKEFKLKCIFEKLDDAEQSLLRLHSLLIKCSIFDFQEYELFSKSYNDLNNLHSEYKKFAKFMKHGTHNLESDNLMTHLLNTEKEWHKIFNKNGNNITNFVKINYQILFAK